MFGRTAGVIIGWNAVEIPRKKWIELHKEFQDEFIKDFLKEFDLNRFAQIIPGEILGAISGRNIG